MSAKGVIRKPLQWSQSRRFFYDRLRRRLAEDSAKGSILRANPTVGSDQAASELRSLVTADWDDDNAVAEWFARNASKVEERAAEIKRAFTISLLRAQLSDLDQAGRAEVLK